MEQVSGWVDVALDMWVSRHTIGQVDECEYH